MSVTRDARIAAVQEYCIRHFGMSAPTRAIEKMLRDEERGIAVNEFVYVESTGRNGGDVKALYAVYRAEDVLLHRISATPQGMHMPLYIPTYGWNIANGIRHTLNQMPEHNHKTYRVTYIGTME